MDDIVQLQSETCKLYRVRNVFYSLFSGRSLPQFFGAVGEGALACESFRAGGASVKTLVDVGTKCQG